MEQVLEILHLFRHSKKLQSMYKDKILLTIYTSSLRWDLIKEFFYGFVRWVPYFHSFALGSANKVSLVIFWLRFLSIQMLKFPLGQKYNCLFINIKLNHQDLLVYPRTHWIAMKISLHTILNQIASHSCKLKKIVSNKSRSQLHVSHLSDILPSLTSFYSLPTSPPWPQRIFLVRGGAQRDSLAQCATSQENRNKDSIVEKTTPTTGQKTKQTL